MQQRKSPHRFVIGRLELSLLFAVSVAAGIFTVQVVQGPKPTQVAAEIAQVGFVVEEAAPEIKDAKVLSEIDSSEIPDMKPIIASETRRPELLAQKLNIRPSNSTLRRQSTPSSSFDVIRPMSPSFGSPTDDPFLVDDKNSLTNLIPGEDILSELILKATNKGISVEEVGIERILNLASEESQPLTINDVVRSSEATAALPNTAKFVTPTKNVPPTTLPKTAVANTPTSDLPVTLGKSLTKPTAASLATPELSAPAVASSSLPSITTKPAAEAQAAEPRMSPSVAVRAPKETSVTKPSSPSFAGIKAPIAPSVSSLRAVPLATPKESADVESKTIDRLAKSKTDSVFSIDELLADMEKTPVAELEESVTEVVEPVVEEKPDPSKYVEKPIENADPAPGQQTGQPTHVKSQPPIQYTIPPEPNVVITRQMASLQPKISKTLRFYYDRPLNTKDDSAWSIMHSILGYGQNGMVAINGKKGRRTNGVSWMCSNNPCANRRLFYLDRGYIKGLEGPGFQGHPAQFLAMMAQVKLRRDYPVQVQGYSFKLEDMINSEMYTCSSSGECTFKLIALSHYLHSDAKWRNEQGEIWSIPRLLEIELAQPVNGAACGGTHRVMSICFAVRTRQRRGEPLDGIYVRAEKYMRDYQRYAMSLQNSDGSFSSDWFKRRSDWGDKNRQLQTTGHLLEWLVYSLPRNELSDPRIVKSVAFLTNLMTRHRYHDWEVGPRGHAVRALALYHQRVFERQQSSMPVARLGSLPTEISTLR